jgi:hypothetical protein
MVDLTKLWTQIELTADELGPVLQQVRINTRPAMRLVLLVLHLQQVL